MSRHDYYIASRIEDQADPDFGLWHVLNLRGGARAAGPFDTPRAARDEADALNGAAFIEGQSRAPADLDDELERLATGRAA